MKKSLLSILLALLPIMVSAETNITDYLGTWKCINSIDIVEGETIYNYMKGQLLTVNADGTYATTSEYMGRGTYTINENVFRAKNSSSVFEAEVYLINGILTMKGKTDYGVTFRYEFEKVIDGGSVEEIEDPNASEFTIDGVIYERISNSEVRIVDVKKFVTDLTVPEFIKRGNRTYVVTSIANNACVNGYVETLTLSDHVKLIGEMALYQCELTTLDLGKNLKTIKRVAFALNYKLTTLNIGNNVETIEEGAFRNCYNLHTVIIGSGIRRISLSTFGICYSLKDFYCYAEKLPITYSDTFYDTPIDSATLHVPAAAIESYKTTSPWKNFGNIVPLTDDDPIPTDINVAKFSRPQVENNQIYDLQGRKVTNPQRGIYIQNGKKVIKR